MEMAVKFVITRKFGSLRVFEVFFIPLKGNTTKH